MESSTVQNRIERAAAEPWQLKMFRRSLKKQQKLRALLRVLGAAESLKCLLVTCGDNNGAMNWHFKHHGGEWSWVDAEKDSIAQIGSVTGDPVLEMDKENPVLNFEDGFFDAAITIDVHEHLRDPSLLNHELARVVKPGGRVIVTTPNGDEKKLAVRIKNLIGMRPEVYGHFVVGYDVPELERQLKAAGLTPYLRGSYARFFTEMLELLINFVYVKILSKRSGARVEKGQIAPQNIDQVKSVGKTLKLYSVLYPIFYLISRLDVLDLSPRGYAVIVAARKD
jgi:2-polyprenyl-3-methyl-5-hydroxy-6-metoxy-1,4-benzoquinol methylase